MSEGPQPGPGRPVGNGRVLSDRQRLAWLRLARSEYVGPATFRELLNHFGSAETALSALPDMARRGGAAGRIRICTKEEAEGELSRIDGFGARLAALGEPDYPPLLRHIDGAPPLVTLRGSAAGRNAKTVAIVGARNCSIAGAKLAAALAADLGAAGYLVISGLARGIDAAAHRAALDTGTLAVFAGGIDRIYPTENEDLARRILAADGVHFTDMPFGWNARARDFPRRNRLISGMAQGVVVVEAARRSGSLHTARFALDQGRDVLAVPGFPLDPRSEGSNALIRDGAVLVREAGDVIAALETAAPLPAAPQLVEEDEPEHDFAAPEIEPDARQAVIQALGPVPVGVDELIRHTGLPTSTIQVILLELELAGRLERHPPNQISLIV